jgi:hypothetical protein
MCDRCHGTGQAQFVGLVAKLSNPGRHVGLWRRGAGDRGVARLLRAQQPVLPDLVARRVHDSIMVDGLLYGPVRWWARRRYGRSARGRTGRAVGYGAHGPTVRPGPATGPDHRRAVGVEAPAVGVNGERSPGRLRARSWCGAARGGCSRSSVIPRLPPKLPLQQIKSPRTRGARTRYGLVPRAHAQTRRKKTPKPRTADEARASNAVTIPSPPGQSGGFGDRRRTATAARQRTASLVQSFAMIEDPSLHSPA